MKLFLKNGRKSVYQKIKTLNDLKPNHRSQTYAWYNTSFISEIIFGSHNFMTASAWCRDWCTFRLYCMIHILVIILFVWIFTVLTFALYILKERINRQFLHSDVLIGLIFIRNKSYLLWFCSNFWHYLESQVFNYFCSQFINVYMYVLRHDFFQVLLLILINTMRKWAILQCQTSDRNNSQVFVL